jgi:hypothetical protein
MIKINLAKRKTANLVSPSGDSGDSGLSSMKGLFSRSSGSGSGSGGGLKDWPIRSILIALVGIYGAQFYFEAEKTAEIARVDSMIEKLRASQGELQAKLSGSAGFEEVKRNLEADEKLVKTKLETIVRLMEDKQKSVQALKHVSNSIPAEVWLQSLSFNLSDFQVSGQSIDYNQVSDFMNRLGQADFLSDLNLDGSSQSKDEKGLNVASFRLTAKRK